MALLVIAIARTGPGDKRADNLPPKMGGGVETHFLHARIGQRIEPGIELAETCAHDPDKTLGGQGRVDARKRLAARWFATWPRTKAREWRVTWRMSFLSRR